MPDIANLIRTLAMQSVEASKPVERVFGVVTNKDPFTVQVNEKLVLKGNFLVLTQTVKNYLNWKCIEVGDKVVMTRQKGGQLYIVDDMLACSRDIFEETIVNHTHQYTDIYDETTAKRDTTEGKRVE